MSNNKISLGLLKFGWIMFIVKEALYKLNVRKKVLPNLMYVQTIVMNIVNVVMNLYLNGVILKLGRTKPKNQRNANTLVKHVWINTQKNVSLINVCGICVLKIVTTS